MAQRILGPMRRVQASFLGASQRRCVTSIANQVKKKQSCIYDLKSNRMNILKIYSLQSFSTDRTNACAGTDPSHIMQSDSVRMNVEKAKTAEELLSVLDSLGKERLQSFSTEFILKALTRLVDIVYQEFDEYSWFQSHNYHVAFIQILMNGQLDALSETLHNHRVFHILTELVNQNMDTFNADELADALLSFVRLGVKRTDRVYGDLITRVPELCDDASFKTLVRLCEIHRSENRSNPFLLRKILGRFKNDFDSFNLGIGDLEDMVQLLTLVNYMMSESLCRKILGKIQKVLEDHPEALQDPDKLGMVLRMGRKIVARFPLDKQDKASDPLLIFNQCENAILSTKDLSKFEDHNIAEVCSSLQMLLRYKKEFAEKFRRRALALIEKSNGKLSVISNVMYAFSSATPYDEKRIVEEALYNSIHHADLLILSNLAESIRFMNCTNLDVLEKFQDKVIENIDGLFEFVTRFEKVVRCLIWKNFLNPENERIFVNALLKHLQHSTSQFGLTLWCMGMSATYLLQNTRYIIPEILYRKLVDLIPQCSVKDLYPVMIAMNSLKRPIATSTQNQLYHLQTLIYTSIIKRLDTIVSINLLTSMLRSLILKSKNPDTNMVEKLMSLYVRFSEPSEMNFLKYLKVIEMHSRLDYYNPQVLENLADYAQNNVEDIGFKKVLSLFSLLMKVGYTPRNIDALLEVVLEIYEKSKEEVSIPDQIHFMRCLTQLQVFPKEHLTSIFNLDFIQQVDKYLADNPGHRFSVERSMMILNRTVVLECPELDIPWFHEHYCQETMTTGDRFISPFMNSVGEVLSEVLGGWVYYRKWVFSPYFYSINFEAILDEDGKPINLVKVERFPENSQRLAIQTLFNSQYCYNNRELNGFEKAKHRHLQLLGYKVVKIPLYDWNSMGLADHASKVEYVKKKVFS